MQCEEKIPLVLGLGLLGEFLGFSGICEIVWAFEGLFWGFLSLQIFWIWILDLRDFHRIFGVLRFFGRNLLGFLGFLEIFGISLGF